jgi:hypothetical protein
MLGLLTLLFGQVACKTLVFLVYNLFMRRCDETSCSHNRMDLFEDYCRLQEQLNETIVIYVCEHFLFYFLRVWASLFFLGVFSMLLP